MNEKLTMDIKTSMFKFHKIDVSIIKLSDNFNEFRITNKDKYLDLSSAYLKYMKEFLYSSNKITTDEQFIYILCNSIIDKIN